MAIINLVTLVLRGNPIVGNRVAGKACMGSEQAVGQTPAHMSYPRHPSHRFGRRDQMRLDPVDLIDAETTAIGTGRSPSAAGVLVSRTPAIAAGWTVHHGWSETQAEPQPNCMMIGASADRSAAGAAAIRMHPMPYGRGGATCRRFSLEKPTFDLKPKSKPVARTLVMLASSTRGELAHAALRLLARRFSSPATSR